MPWLELPNTGLLHSIANYVLFTLIGFALLTIKVYFLTPQYKEIVAAKPYLNDLNFNCDDAITTSALLNNCTIRAVVTLY
jgi:hypothetical protein